MKIAILCAMDKELALIQSLIQSSSPFNSDGLKAITGLIGHHSVMLAKCGIGKVNAALNAYKTIKAFNPDLIINSGVAGGVGASNVGDLLVATSAGYSDVWCGPGTKPGVADGFPALMPTYPHIVNLAKQHFSADSTHYAPIATSDRFISTAKEVKQILEIVPDAKAVDMESAAIAQACTMCNIPFAILRVISDTPGREEDNSAQYNDFWTNAPQTTTQAISTILKNL